MTPHAELVSLFQVALAAVGGRTATAAELATRPLPAEPPRLIAIGKAAPAMLAGALDHLYHAGIPPADCLTVTARGHAPAGLPGRVIEAGHPLPDEGSLAAGRAVLAALAADRAEPWFLMSGGGSALFEVPAPGLTLADLRRASDWLLGSGLDIVAMNRVRRGLSAVKGGRLAGYLRGRSARQLLISDVPEAEPAAIASGPLYPETTGGPWPPGLPEWLRLALERSPAAPAANDPALAGLRSRVIADNRLAREAVAMAARRRGWAVTVADGLAGDAGEVGARLGRWLRDEAPPGLHILGGETTVTLPESPGRGGRNSHLALAAARALEGAAGITLLAAGTDGRDGDSEAAGAWVDGETAGALRQAGHEPDALLAAADSASGLAAIGHAVVTGPTGTNVADLVLARKEPATGG